MIKKLISYICCLLPVGAGAVVVEPESGKTYVSTEQAEWLSAGTSTVVIQNPSVNSILSANGFVVGDNMYLGATSDQGSDQGDLYILNTVKNPFTVMSAGDVSIGAMLQVMNGKSLAFETSGDLYNLTIGSGNENEGIIIGDAVQSANLTVNGVRALTVNGTVDVFGNLVANVASAKMGVVNANTGGVNINATGDVVLGGVTAMGDGQTDVVAGGDITVQSTVQNMVGDMQLDADGDITIGGNLENSGAGMFVAGKSVVVDGTMKNDAVGGELTIVADDLYVTGGDANSYSVVNNGDFVASVKGVTELEYGINLSGMSKDNVFSLDTGSLEFGDGADSEQWFAAFANRLNDFTLLVRQDNIDMSAYQSGLLNGAQGNGLANMLVGAKNVYFSNVRNSGNSLRLVAGGTLVGDLPLVQPLIDVDNFVGNIKIANQLIGDAGSNTSVIASNTLEVATVSNSGYMNLNANSVNVNAVSNTGAGAQLNISSLTDQTGVIAIQSNVVNTGGSVTISAKDVSVGGALINNGGTLTVKGSDSNGDAIQIGQIDAKGGITNIDALAGELDVGGAVTVSNQAALNFGANLTDVAVDGNVQIAGDFTASANNATGGGDVNVAASGANNFKMSADSVLIDGGLTIDDANVVRHVLFDTVLVNVDGDVNVQNKGMLTSGLMATNYTRVGGALNVSDGGVFESYGYNLYVGSMSGDGKFLLHGSSIMADKGGVDVDGNLYFDAENDVANPSNGLIVRGVNDFSITTQATGADIAVGAVSVGTGNNLVLKSADEIVVDGVLNNNGATTLNATNNATIAQLTTNNDVLDVSGANVGMNGIKNTGVADIVATGGNMSVGDVETSNQMGIVAVGDLTAGAITQTGGRLDISAANVKAQTLGVSGGDSVANIAANTAAISGGVKVAGDMTQGGADGMLNLDVSEFGTQNLTVGGDLMAVSGNTTYNVASDVAIAGNIDVAGGTDVSVDAGGAITVKNITNSGDLKLDGDGGLVAGALVNNAGVMHFDSGNGVFKFDTLQMNSGNLVLDGREMIMNGAINTGAMLYQKYTGQLQNRDINIVADAYEMTTNNLVVSGINQSGQLVVNTSDVDVAGDIVAGDLRFMANSSGNWMNVNVGGSVSGNVDFVGLEKMTIGKNYVFNSNSALNVAVLPYESGNTDATDIDYWASVNASDVNPIGQIVNPDGEDARALIFVGGVFTAGTQYSDDAFSLNSSVSSLKDGQIGITLRDTVDQGSAIWLVHAEGGVENAELVEQIRNLNVNFCNADGSICYNYLESLADNNASGDSLLAYLSVRDLDGDGIAHDIYVVFDPSFGGPVLLNDFKIQSVVERDANHTDGEFVSAGALDDLLIDQARKKQFANGVPMEVVPLIFAGTNMEQMANELYNRMEYYVQTSNGSSLASFSRLFQVREIEQVAGAIALNEHTNFRSFEDRMFDEFIWNRNRNLKKAWLDVDYGMFYQNIDDGKHTDGNRFGISGGFDWQESDTLILGLTGRVSHSSSSAFDAMDLGYLPNQAVAGRVDIDVTDTDIGLGAYLMKTLGEKVRVYGNAFLDVHVFDINRTQNFVADIDGNGNAVSLMSEWGLMHDILNQYIVGNLYARGGYNFGFNITEKSGGDDYMKLQSDGYFMLTPGYSLVAQKRIYPSSWFQIRPYASVGIEYDVFGAPDHAEYRFAPSRGFTEYAIDIDPLWANIGGGIELLSANGLQFGVDYRYQYNDAIQLHNIKVSGSYRF